MLHVRPQHIHRCLACLILATMLMMMPALAEVESRGLLISAQDGQTSDDPLVWIPRSGSKYHSKSTCSNMKNPIQVTLSEAKKSGYDPCKKCHPPT